MGESGTRLAAILVQMQSNDGQRITLVVPFSRRTFYEEVLVLEVRVFAVTAVANSYLPLPST
eukprot:15160-Heterococcus_DN1.PRE.4